MTDPLSPDMIPSFDEAVAAYSKAVEGDAEAALSAERLFERLRADSPGNPLADAYYGSCQILIARDLQKPMMKLRRSNQGLKILDGAVAASPRDARIRLMRAKSSFRLPEKYFQRTQTVIEDFLFIVEEHSRGNAILQPEEYWRLLHDLGEAYARIGRNQDAAATWQSLEAQTDNPGWQQRAREKLQTLVGKPATETKSDIDTLSVLIEATRAISSKLVNWSAGLEKDRNRVADRKRKRDIEVEKKQAERKKAVDKRKQSEQSRQSRQATRERQTEQAKPASKARQSEQARPAPRARQTEQAKPIPKARLIPNPNRTEKSAGPSPQRRQTSAKEAFYLGPIVKKGGDKGGR